MSRIYYCLIYIMGIILIFNHIRVETFINSMRTEHEWDKKEVFEVAEKGQEDKDWSEDKYQQLEETT